MSRTQHLRWKRKAAAVAALTVGFTGYVAIGAATVSAGNDGAWDCSETQVTSYSYDDCTYPDDTYPNDTYPDDTVPVDSVPVDSVPVETDPPATDPPTTVARAGVPGVSGAGLCANGSGTVNLTLSNRDGDLPVTFVVTHPVSGVSTSMTVPSSSSEQLALLGTKVGTINVRIVAGAADLSQSFDVSCPKIEQPAAVAPEIVRAADVLPATGRTSTLASLFIALGLVGAGSVAIAVARRSANSRSRQA